MSLKKKSLIISLAITSSLLFTACSSKNEQVKKHSFKSDTSELELKSNNPTLIFVRPGAKDLSTYQQFMIDPIKVDYDDPSVKKLNQKQVKKLQEYFHNSLVSKLKENNLNVVNSIGSNTLKMSFVISGIKAPNPAANVVSLLAPIALSVGEVTVEGTFINTTSNKIDAVVVNKSKGSNLLNDTPWSTWADIESSFEQWSDGIVKSIIK